jgi:excisionase family DNA binding protein
MDDEILTVDEAAAMLKVDATVVTDLLVSNELPGRHIGGQWRTTRRALVSYVDGVPLQAMCCAPGECCTAEGANCCC